MIKSHRTFVIFAIICLSIMLFCAGCAGSGYKRSVPAKAFPSGNVLEIDVGAELNPGWYLSFGANQFSSELPLSELVQKIRCDSATFQDVSAMSQDKLGILIWVPSDNATKDVYYLNKQTATGEPDWYLFSGLRYQLCYDQLENRKEDEPDLVLFPGFCLDGAAADTLELSYGIPYPCNAVTVENQVWDDLPQAISAFYEATGYFDTELQASILSVRAKASAPDVPSLSLRFTRVEEQTYLTFLPLS